MKATFTLSREAVQLVEMMGTAPRRLQELADEAIKKVAEEITRRVTTRVLTQGFGPLELTPAYRVRKQRQGLDPRTLVATSDYLKSIRLVKLSPGHYAIEADPVKRGVFEEGTKTNRKRPHWEPVLNEMQDEAPAIFAQTVLKRLFKGGT